VKKKILPQKYSPSPFAPVIIDHVCEPPMPEVYECPRCHYRIPVDIQHTNWEYLYKAQCEFTVQTIERFTDFINRLCADVPDAKIFVELEKEELENAIRKLGELFKGDQNK